MPTGRHKCLHIHTRDFQAASPTEDGEGLPFLCPPTSPPDPEWREHPAVVTSGRPREADNFTGHDDSSWEVALARSTRGRAVLPPGSTARSSVVSLLLPIHNLYSIC